MGDHEAALALADGAARAAAPEHPSHARTRFLAFGIDERLPQRAPGASRALLGGLGGDAEDLADLEILGALEREREQLLLLGCQARQRLGRVVSGAAFEELDQL